MKIRKKIWTIFWASVIFPQDTTLVLVEESSVLTVDSANPSLELFSPNGGEMYESGASPDAEWNASDDSFGESPVTISIISTLGGFSEVLVDATGNDGIEPVILPEINTGFARINIEVVDEFGNTNSDISDGYFTIGNPEEFEPGDSTLTLVENSETLTVDSDNPTVELFSPNGGEAYESGASSDAEWNASDDSFGESPVTISIISTLGGFSEVLVDATGNDGIEPVILPEINTGFARINIEVVDEFGNTNSDISDGYFTIGNPEEFEPGDSTLTLVENSETLTVDSDNPTVELFSPNGGEYYIFGGDLILDWSASDLSFNETPISFYINYELGGSYGPFLTDVENTGLIEVNVPATETEYGRIKVTAMDTFGNSSFDESNDYFTLGESTLEMNLHTGANLVSFHTLPEGDCTLLEDVLPECITGIIGEGVASVQVSPGVWVGSLSCVEYTSGYWVKTEEDCSFDISGVYCGADLVYNLSPGNNLISYSGITQSEISSALPDDVECLFDGLIGEGVAASQISCQDWVGSLSQFDGGKGYWAKVTEDLSFSFEIDGFTRVTDDTEPSTLIPEPWTYNQSTEQAFYFVEDVQMDGLQAANFWLLAYCGKTLVGTREWTGAYTDVPAMGTDGYDETAGYCETGEIPRFELLTTDGLKLEAHADHTPEWAENGLFFISLSATGVEIPTEFVLKPAYPNPFNPVTTIEFSIPAVEPQRAVSLNIYDITGRHVAELINRELNAGMHIVQWDAGYQSSGLYFVKLTAGEFQQTQKVLLLK